MSLHSTIIVTTYYNILYSNLFTDYGDEMTAVVANVQCNESYIGWSLTMPETNPQYLNFHALNYVCTYNNTLLINDSALIKGQTLAESYSSYHHDFEIPVTAGAECTVRGCYYNAFDGSSYLLTVSHNCKIGK